MFNELKEINSRPAPFQFYTADELWTNEHTAKQMLECHLNGSIDVSSRNTNFIRQSTEWIIKHFNVNKGIEIADFGCGPGLYTTKLAEQGAIVTGIDFSKNSLEYGKQVAASKGLKINYVNINYLDYESAESFDLIIMIMCDFCALSPEQRKTLLAKFYSLLKPNGAVLLDVYSLNSFNQIEETSTYELNQLNGFWSSDDYYCFVNTFKYEHEKVILDKYTIFGKSDKRVVYNWLQYYNKETLIKEFEENGLIADEIYSDVGGTVFNSESAEIAVVARKP